MITGVIRIGCNRQEGGFCVAPKKSFITLLVGCVLLVAPPSFAAALIDQVTVGYSSFSGAYVPLWVAVEEQLGRKYGLELKAIYAGRVRPQQLLASGEVPFVIATGTGALSSHILGVKESGHYLDFHQIKLIPGFSPAPI
jgi:hypothetical protein